MSFGHENCALVARPDGPNSANELQALPAWTDPGERIQSGGVHLPFSKHPAQTLIQNGAQLLKFEVTFPLPLIICLQFG